MTDNTQPVTGDTGAADQAPAAVITQTPTADMGTVLHNAALIAGAVSPLLPPNAQLALTTATLLMNAVQHAQAQGTDLTNEQLMALFAVDDAARQADAAAQVAMQSANVQNT